jgi:cob(I)alamin adenosyltransferase
MAMSQRDASQRDASQRGASSIADVRESAVGEIEEANATVGAALCSGTVPARFVLLLRDVQNDLLALAADLSAPGPDGRGHVIDATAVQQVLAAVDEHRTEPVPAEFAVLGGSTTGVGLLRLARMTVRRAARSVRRGERGGTAPGVGDCAGAYLDALAELLLVLAFESELLEREQLPVGWCDGSSMMAVARIVPRREGRGWLSTRG